MLAEMNFFYTHQTNRFDHASQYIGPEKNQSLYAQLQTLPCYSFLNFNKRGFNGLNKPLYRLKLNFIRGVDVSQP